LTNTLPDHGTRLVGGEKKEASDDGWMKEEIEAMVVGWRWRKWAFYSLLRIVRFFLDSILVRNNE
jgi:hypothetical protein